MPLTSVHSARAAASRRAIGALARLALAGAFVASCSGGGDLPRDASPAPSATAAATSPSGDSLLARADRGRVQGDPDAPVWMVVVSDFECPYCARWHAQSYDELRRAYVETGKIRVAYLNYPLPNHRHAWPAAEAAMCAGLQGKFWPVHDAIFQTQDRWRALENAVPLFDSLAAAQGLDMEAQRGCLTRRATRPLIDADMARIQKAGVTGTPTFFIGRRTISGLGPTAAYRAAIDSALAEAAAGAAGARP